MTDRVLLTGGTVIDGTGRPPLSADVLIEGDRIKAVGSADDFGSLPESIERHDCAGHWILPGLMDLHVHLMRDGRSDPQASSMGRRAVEDESTSYLFAHMVANAVRTLEAGFTLVREAGAKDFASVDLRRAIEDGVVTGPRVLAAQPIIMTGGHTYRFAGIEADGVTEVRKAARMAIKRGVDVIKTMATGGVMTAGVEPGSPQMSVEEMRAAFEEAHNAGRRTMTHAQGARGIRNVVEAGVDCVDHGHFMGTDDSVVALVRERGVAFVATLAVELCKVEAEERATSAGESFPIPEIVMRKSRTMIEPHRITFQKAMEAGILLGCGTDSGGPFNFHGQNAYELEVMVRYGMSPLEALSTATLRSAQIVGRDVDLGSLEAGKLADIVVIDGDPVADIRALRAPNAVRAVYLAGRLVAGARHRQRLAVT